jgi:error-prone DNA polymerase
MSLEDDTGISNLIVWPSIQTQQHQPVLSAHLMVVQGELQNEMKVIHVIAEKVRDYSHWLGRSHVESRNFR